MRYALDDHNELKIRAIEPMHFTQRGHACLGATWVRAERFDPGSAVRRPARLQAGLWASSRAVTRAEASPTGVWHVSTRGRVRRQSRPEAVSFSLCTAAAVPDPGEGEQEGVLRESKPSDVRPTSPSSTSPVEIALSVVLVVALAVVNRILYRMALVPLENYVFFLAQFQTFAYVIAYVVVLAIQAKRQKLAPTAWQLPWQFRRMFLGIGFVEAVSALLSFIGAAKLPGVTVPLLSQTILVWQVVLVYLVLKRSLTWMQLVGVAGVVGGVALAAWPGNMAVPSIWTSVNPKYVCVYVFSCLFPAIDTLLKDRLFRKGKAWQGGRDVDLFVVNTFGSASQAVFVFLLLPLVTQSRGIPLSGLGTHLAMGWDCFRGLTPACGSDCAGAPLLPVLYVAVNLLFNISALNLISKAGNMVFSLVMSGIVPVTMWAFTLPIPVVMAYLGAPPVLGINFPAGSLLLTLGLIVYNSKMLFSGARFARAVPSLASSDGDENAR